VGKINLYNTYTLQQKVSNYDFLAAFSAIAWNFKAKFYKLI